MPNPDNTSPQPAAPAIPDDTARAFATAQELHNRFTYHAPKPGQPERYTELRAAAHTLAIKIVAQCPDSRERAIALTKIEEAVFWANAAIARNE